MECNHHRDERKACSCVATYEAIVGGEEIPKLEGYCAIAREASRHPELLTHFPSDLITHDRAILTDYIGPFLWVLRDYGTVLVKPFVEGQCTVEGIVHAFGTDNTLWFWWDGRALRQLKGPEHADAVLEDAAQGVELEPAESLWAVSA